MNEEVREQGAPARAADGNSAAQTAANRKFASKTRGWIIAGASVAVLLSITAWKSRFDDEEYLRS
ncbi:MAG: hypothetical protein H0V88_08265 [Pyrinomonadaceae bacterium]|nr:hypothetical protein [Pyrinomonadaceae bacterium]